MGARGDVSKARLYYIIPDVRNIWSLIPKQPSQVWDHMNKPRRTIILSQTWQERRRAGNGYAHFYLSHSADLFLGCGLRVGLPQRTCWLEGESWPLANKETSLTNAALGINVKKRGSASHTPARTHTHRRAYTHTYIFLSQKAAW